ncbi:MAG: carbohydrate binding domain-containing protein, partial [Muribaculaceae bacterium]|nr:carbohydrate binding domain-containing protein [Muribaculaceae bacterium]
MTKKLLSIALLASALTAGAENLVLQTNKPGAEIPETMYGIFFEDINYGADGGLYAEMIKNRSFDFLQQPLMGWKTFGNVDLLDDGPFDRNPHYTRLNPSGHGEKYTGLENEGFFGVTFHKDSVYRFSAWMRAPQGGKPKVRVELCDPASQYDTQVFASAEIEVESGQWTRYTAELKPWESASKGVFRMFLVHPDKTPVDVEHVSLFPSNTWKGRENGMRADLAQALYDLRPGVFRFPGGCIVEGTEMPDRYQWKNTVGPVENRPVNLNRWHYTFPWRFYPDYYQSNGLGFFEYFQLSEDMGAEPLPVLNVGMVCQYQNSDLHAHCATDSLNEFIQDALDLIEFANGSTTSTWGKVRADMGHPEPFGLKYLSLIHV